METATIYEYMIDKGNVIQLVHTAEYKEGKYYFKAGKTKHYTILKNTDLGVVINNHVFSLKNNYKKYRDILIECLRKRVEKEKMKLIADKRILFDLQCAAVQQDTGFDKETIGCFLSNYKIPHVCPVAIGGWCKGYTTCQNLESNNITI